MTPLIILLSLLVLGTSLEYEGHWHRSEHNFFDIPTGDGQEYDIFGRGPNRDYQKLISKIQRFKGEKPMYSEEPRQSLGDPKRGVGAPPPPPFASYQIGGLQLGLRSTSRAIQNLSIIGDPLWGHNFSFVPPLWQDSPSLPDRSHPGAHFLGDVTIRVQPGSSTNTTSWATYSSVWGSTNVACTPVTVSGAFDACDLTGPLGAPGQPDTRYPLGLKVIRSFSPVNNPDGFIMKFTVTNSNSSSVRIGGFGMTLPADCTWGSLNTQQVASTLSFIDGSISGTRSYATWTRADGSRTLVVTPGNTNTPMEAWRPVLEDRPEIQGGTYEWTVLSAAWASEWNTNRQWPYLTMAYTDSYGEAAWPNSARTGKSPWPEWHLSEVYTSGSTPPSQWNPPTSKVLNAGESTEFSLRFTLASGGPETREATIKAVGEPVLHSVPGYAIATDMTNANLYALPPKGATVTAVSADPSSALTVTLGATLSSGYRTIALKALRAYTRVRVVVTYSDGTTQATSYFTLPALSTQINNYGNWATNTAWLPADYDDPFARGASVMPWDREDKVHLLQDGRPFIVGLSDDAGGGNHLGYASKVNFAPDQTSVTRIDDYIKLTLMSSKNGTQYANPHFALQESNDRILMTTYYYHYDNSYTTAQQFSYPNLPNYYTELNKCNIYPSWCAFNAISPQNNVNTWKPADYRVYNFPHQINSYYALYRVARNYNYKTYQTWDWYLNRAYSTLLAFGCYNSGTGQFTCIPNVGVMDGTVFREVLYALQEEALADSSWTAKASHIESMMYNRTISGENGSPGWNSLPAPFGSEFNWDTTGQEEVAIWGAYFNATSTTYGNLNQRVVAAILAYTPNVPNWAWHGSAAGWGDFSNNAKWMVMAGWEREGQHYRAGLNSIPVIERFRTYPTDYYLLETAMGALTGTLCNIDVNGAPSMGYHTHPFIQDYDPNSGDYGLAFFGQSLTTGSYLVNHPDLGWICYLCDITASTSTTVSFVSRDPFHRRLYVAPVGLWVVSLAGVMDTITLDLSKNQVSIVFEAAGGNFAQYVLQLKNPALSLQHTFKISSPTGVTSARGSYFVPLAGTGTQTVVITW